MLRLPLNGDPVSATLQSWAESEFAPWRALALSEGAIERGFNRMLRRFAHLRLYTIEANCARMAPVADGLPEPTHLAKRADLYLRFFQSAAELLPADTRLRFCAGIADKLAMKSPVPVFCFQRDSAQIHPLMPDIDFLVHDFYADPSFSDTTPYAAKANRAVFAGSTTGGRISAEIARTAGVPRLRAARYFAHEPAVDFRLPGIVQCDSEEARAILLAESFCQRPQLSWQQQFENRFLISIDGNGATCSRVAVALRSNCVLLKYASDHVLYYFRGMTPHRHYIPIAEDCEIPAIVAQESALPGGCKPIADAGRAFADAYLPRARVIEYAARLLLEYGHAAGREKV
jgi:hypothetical protein